MCQPAARPPESTRLAPTMVGKKRDDALLLAAAVDRLNARRDPLDETRWLYFAMETQSLWSVTSESMIAFGAMPDTEDAYNEWAESDSTSHERESPRRW
jgi:hypothetical protein